MEKSYNTEMKTIRFTKEGYERLKKEQEDLLKERIPTLADLKKAREMGDLKENGLYQATRFKLTFLDRRLRVIGYTLKQAVVVEGSKHDAIAIGTIVKLSDGKKEIIYQIVGDLEADPKQGKISLLSPLGKALEGKKAGGTTRIQTPHHIANYTILTVS